MKENNYAFIDSNNLYLGIKEQGWELDFFKFRVYLKDKFQVNKAFLFIGYIPGNEHLYKQLQKENFILIFKPILAIKKKSKTMIKGNVDSELVLHTMIEYNNYDQAVIVSGDGDFRCLLEHLKDNNKLNRLIVPNRRKYSYLLKPFMRDMFFLTPKFKKKLGK